jgi:hypothetical protein
VHGTKAEFHRICCQAKEIAQEKTTLSMARQSFGLLEGIRIVDGPLQVSLPSRDARRLIQAEASVLSAAAMHGKGDA